MHRVVILISGKAGCGKDTTAELIVKQLEAKEKGVKQLSFAEPMKRIIATTMGILPSTLDTYKNDTRTYGLVNTRGSNFGVRTDYRRILQRFGTEAMKSEFGKHVWTDLVWDKIRYSKLANIFVVPDWRFKEELYRLEDKVHQMNDKIIRVRVERDGLVSNATHISEVDLDTEIDFDYIIKNDGISLINLDKAITEVLEAEELFND